MPSGTTASDLSASSISTQADEQGAIHSLVREYSASLIENENADALGEILRAWAFVGEGFGCYSTFDLGPEFKPQPPTEREFTFLWGRAADDELDTEEMGRIQWFKHPSGIEVGWHWDGDGWLGFVVPEINALLRNDDCKCSYDWKWLPLNEATQS